MRVVIGQVEEEGGKPIIATTTQALTKLFLRAINFVSSHHSPMSGDKPYPPPLRSPALNICGDLNDFAAY